MTCPWNDPHCSRCAEAVTDDFFVALAETERKMEEDAVTRPGKLDLSAFEPLLRDHEIARRLTAADREPRDIRCTCGANGRINAYHAKACPCPNIAKRPPLQLAIGDHVMLTSKNRPESQRAVYLGRAPTTDEVRLRLVSGDGTLSAEVMFLGSVFEWCAMPTESISTHEPAAAPRGRTRLKPGVTL